MPLSPPTVFEDYNCSNAKAFSTNILIVGGAYAGLAAVRSLKSHFAARAKDPIYAEALATKSPKISITIVEPKAGFLNIIGIPKAVVSPEFAKTQYVPMSDFKNLMFDHVFTEHPEISAALETRSRIGNDNLSAGIEITLVHGHITRISEKTASYTLSSIEGNHADEVIQFDYAILASGRDRTWPTTPRGFTFPHYMKEMEEFRQKVDAANRISVVGAGAVGIEMAGDIKHEFPHKDVTLIHPHPTAPPEPLSAAFGEAISSSLLKSGVKLLYNTRVLSEKDDGTLVTQTGDEIPTDLTVWCTSHTNNIGILDEGLSKRFVSPAKNVHVNEYLQLANGSDMEPRIFVAGDLVELPIIKSAGWAMYMGRQCAHNITSMILDDHLAESFPDLLKMPRGMVLVAGNGEIISELCGEVELNNQNYTHEYKDYCLNKVMVTLDV